MPDCARTRYGYQSTPQSEAPASRASAGSGDEGGGDAKRIICGMEIDVSVVTYRTEPAALHALAASLAEEPNAGKLSIYVHDNSESHEAMRAACARIEAQRTFARVVFTPSPRNLGFGLAHNANARLARAPLFFVLNPDCVLEPGALDAL